MAPPRKTANTRGKNARRTEESDREVSDEEPSQRKIPSITAADNSMPGPSDTTFQFGQRFGANSQHPTADNVNGFTPIAQLDANTK